MFGREVMESEGRAMREAVGRRGGRVKSWTSGLGIRGIFASCSCCSTMATLYSLFLVVGCPLRASLNDLLSRNLML